MYAPETVTRGETFLWYRVDPKLQVGLAYLWKQEAFRVLGNYEVVAQTATKPNLRVGFGIQGIATGNPGYFATSEKNFSLPEGEAMAYVGIGYRSNEDHAHFLGGAKFTPKTSKFTLGVQLDGHEVHPLVSMQLASDLTIGAYWIETRTLGLMLSLRR